MPDVDAVRVSPTWGVPLTAGAPVAGLLVVFGPVPAVSFVTSCPLKEAAARARVSRMKKWVPPGRA